MALSLERAGQYAPGPGMSFHNSLLSQSSLTRNNGAVLNRGQVVTSDETVRRHPLVEPRQKLQRARSVSPVTHQIADDREHGNHVNTGSLHAQVRDIPDERSGSARGFDVGPDRVAFGTKGEREESGTYSNRFNPILLLSL